jgi:PleD family two-component response regulator
VGAQPFDIGAGGPLTATCSAGAIGVEAGSDASLEALIEAVDAALYDAKHGGRNRSVIAP